MELDFCSFHIETALNFKSQGTEKFKLLSQGTYDSEDFRYETLVVADYEFEICKSFQNCCDKYKVMNERRS